MRKGIIDRFEGDLAVIEIDGHTIDLPKAQLAGHAKAGDVVEEQNGMWRVLQQETQSRSKKIKKLMNDLWTD